MARPKGSRNVNYEQVRTRLLEAVEARLLKPDGAQASFQELASAAGVSVPTLRHYFRSHEALLLEVMKDLRRRSLPYLYSGALESQGDVRQSLRWMLERFTSSWPRFIGPPHAFCIAAGIGHESLGPAYVRELLEPTLQVVEARLARHMAQGELRQSDLRSAALSLFGPLMLALLHQHQLGGAKDWSQDLQAFIQQHLEGFLKAYGTAPERPRPRPAAKTPRRGRKPAR